MTPESNKTASLLVIGNEILSGKTQDKNLNYIAKKLVGIGVVLVEVRIVRDIQAEIVTALNELRNKFDYVFTTGGIGPTHDDITIDAVAVAFGKKVVEHPLARAKLEEYYAQRGAELNEARLRMARFPENAELIDNPLTAAPGCKIENVFVLAGIPNIMQVMFDYASQFLQKGRKIHSKAIYCDLVEGNLAERLTDIQSNNNDTEIGSYPYVFQGKYAVSLVVRSTDKKAVETAAQQIEEMIKSLGGNFLEK
jgi:molybdenum cofactor synthesis domain-containing protein